MKRYDIAAANLQNEFTNAVKLLSLVEQTTLLELLPRKQVCSGSGKLWKVRARSKQVRALSMQVSCLRSCRVVRSPKSRICPMPQRLPPSSWA